jgi:hypothetical protein
VVAQAHEDVLGLDVAMDEVDLVGGVERLRDGLEEPQRAGSLELSRDDEVLQRGPPHEAHRDEQGAVDLAGLVDGDDVRVVDGRLDLPLAAEPLAERLVGAQLRREDLERDEALERDLSRGVDDPHSAVAEDALDAIAGDLGSWLEHASLTRTAS